MRAGFGFLVWGSCLSWPRCCGRGALFRLEPGGAGGPRPGRVFRGPKAWPGWCIVLFLWRIAGENRKIWKPKVGELERLTDSLNEVPDEELVEALGEAVELLAEINASIEDRLDAAGEESREIGDLLGR